MISLEETKRRYNAAFDCDFDSPAERPDYLVSLWRYCETLRTPAIVVELGVYTGRSTAVMACALHGSYSRIVAIDPVFGSGELWVPDWCPEGRVRYASELRNVVNRWSAMGVAHLISTVALTSAEAYEMWDGTSVDLVVVDGEHSASAVTEDSRWSVWVSPGGMMCYDDWVEVTAKAARSYFSTRPEWRMIHESTRPVTDQGWALTLWRRNA